MNDGDYIIDILSNDMLLSSTIKLYLYSTTTTTTTTSTTLNTIDYPNNNNNTDVNDDETNNWHNEYFIPIAFVVFVILVGLLYYCTYHFKCKCKKKTRVSPINEKPKTLPKLRGLCSGGLAEQPNYPPGNNRSVPNPQYESNNNFVRKQRRSKRSMSNLEPKYSTPTNVYSNPTNVYSNPTNVYSNKSNNYNNHQKNVYSKLSRNDDDKHNYSHLKADRHRKTKRKTPISSRRMYNNDTYVDI